jgi:hypothetical protein
MAPDMVNKINLVHDMMARLLPEPAGLHLKVLQKPSSSDPTRVLVVWILPGCSVRA